MKHFTLPILVICALIVIVSCAKNEDEQPSPEQAKLDNLKNLFELRGGISTLPNPLSSQPSRASSYTYEELMTYPVWEQTTAYEDDNQIFYYVPVQAPSSILYYFNIEQSFGAITMSNTAIAQPISRIIGIFDKQSEQTAFMITTAIPDSTYTLCSDYPLINFSGVYIYSTLESKPIYGVEYSDGEVVNYLFFDTTDGQGANSDTKVSVGIGIIKEEEPASRAIRVSQDIASIEIEAVECVARRPSKQGIGGGANLFPPFNNNNLKPYPNGYTGPMAGGGSGNNTSSTPSSEQTAKANAPTATKIFDPKSKLNKEEWKLVEKLITKLKEDCLASFMASSLSGIDLAVSKNPPSTPGVNGTYKDGKMNIYNINSPQNLGTFFHELFHAAQDKYYKNLNNHLVNGRPNIEFEAYLWVNLYQARTNGRASGEVLDDSKNPDYMMDVSNMFSYGTINISKARLNQIYNSYIFPFADYRYPNMPLDSNLQFNLISNIYDNSKCKPQF